MEKEKVYIHSISDQVRLTVTSQVFLLLYVGTIGNMHIVEGRRTRPEKADP